MNFRQIAFGSALVALSSASLLAQGTPRSECLPGTPGSVVGTTGQGGDACQKGVDLFNYLAPQLGTVIAGGNPILGQGGSLGGLGHFAITLRGTVLKGGLPDVEAGGLTAGSVDGGQNRTAYEVKDQIIGAPTVDAAVGVFGGVPLGLTRVGGVDVLASAFYLPKVNEDQVLVEPTNGSLKIGFGVRVGLIGETAALPGVAFSFLKRDLPKTGITVRPIGGTDDLIALQDMENNTTEWRLTAGKKFGPLAIAVGYGQDKYESSAVLDYNVSTGCTQSCPARPLARLNFDRETKASNLFANLQVNLLLFKLVGEIGQVKLNDVSASQFYNTFSQEPDKSRMYGSVGLKFGR